MWPGETSVERRLWQLSAALCFCLCFLTIASRGLWTPDEPRVAGIILEMADSGDIVIPKLGGEPFVQKPPLYLAVAAGSAVLLGPIIGEVGAMRLTSALWAVGAIAVAYLLARLLARSRRDPDATFRGQLADDDEVRREALLAALVLATMVGFGKNMHWLRVDPALVFFVPAAVWAFAEVYLGGRMRMLPLAGFFLAGAFLTKGLVGGVLIAAGWVGLFVPWLLRSWKRSKLQELGIGMHLLSLLVFLVFAGSWVVALRLQGGEELWNDWFWKNQVGRAVGISGQGHSRPGEPLFYPEVLLTHGLPWSPFVIAWVIGLWRSWRSERRVKTVDVFLLCWMGISLVIMSTATTKRDVYIIPMLPACAVMIAPVLRARWPVWGRWFIGVWNGLALVALAGLAIIPAFWPLLPADVLEKTGPDAAQWTFWSFFACVSFLACIHLLFRCRQESLAQRSLLVTVLLLLSFLGVGVPILDVNNSVAEQIRSFGEPITQAEREKIAGYRFTESMRGHFYTNLRWSMPWVDADRAIAILEGRDPEYTSVMVNGDLHIPQLDSSAYTVRSQLIMPPAAHAKPVHWVVGVGEVSNAGSQRRTISVRRNASR